jgi:uncharacterized protein involved in exopolysaccharide biosynthesis/Mrp family chromosome partitioning ATPase
MVTAYPPHGSSGADLGAARQTSDGSVDLTTLLGGIWRRKAVIFGLILTICLAAYAALLWITPLYSSQSKILVSERETAFTRVERNIADRLPDQHSVRSEVQVLLSEDLALRTIRKLKLTKNPEFNSSANSVSLWTIIDKVFGRPAKTVTASAERRAMNTYFKNLSVEPVPISRVITIKFWSKDSATAALVVNTLADLYLQSTREAKLEAMRHATKWLTNRAGQLRIEVAKADRAVANFRTQSGLVRGDDGTRLTDQTLSEINKQIVLASAARSQAQARAREIRTLLRRRGGLDSAAAVINSRLIQRLAEQRALIKRQQADMSARYLSSHPNIVRIKAELAGLNRQIKTEARKIAASLDNQARVAGMREASLRRSLTRAKSRTSLDNKEQVKLDALTLEAKAKRELLSSLLSRLRDAAARQDVESQAPSARIISHAQVSQKPSYPKKGSFMFLAILGAALIGVTVALFMELNARPAIAYAHAARVGAVPGHIPQPVPQYAQAPNPHATPQMPEVPVIGNLSPAYAGLRQGTGANREQFGLITQAIAANKSSSGGSRIVLTAERAEAADIAAGTDLARTLAADGYTTLLIDADFRNPELADAAGVRHGPGLAELLTGSATFSDVIVQDDKSNLQIIPAGTNPASARPDLLGQRLNQLLEALGEVYDFILIDGGPVGAHSDVLTMAQNASIILVFAQNREMAVQPVNRLNAAGLDRIGVILRG